MVRLVQVFVPQAKVEKVRGVLEKEQHACGLAEILGSSYTMFTFRAAEKHVSRINENLTSVGVGKDGGSIDISGLQSTLPALDTYNPAVEKKKKRKYKLTDRMTIGEVYEGVDCHLTFNFLANIICAGFIAGAGLLSDSASTVVAAMLVSPLMGPIIALTFGVAVGESDMWRRGFRNEFIGIGLCLLVGFFIGVVTIPIFAPSGVIDPNFKSQLESSEMLSRGDPNNLLPGFFVAAPSGVGVALGLTGGGINALVGVAISAALLPPIVNAGMCLVYGFWFYAHDNPIKGLDFAYMGVCSFSLFLMNFVTIFIFTSIIFAVKKINKEALAPYKSGADPMGDIRMERIKNKLGLVVGERTFNDEEDEDDMEGDDDE